MAKNAEEAALEYRQALDDLKDNNKMQINLMTILAEDYNTFSKEIVAVIAQQITKVPPSQKLAVLYVMDSVLKNVTAAGNYKEHIEKTIHQVFVHVFEMGDERTRSALHKLRQTWTGIFQRSTLYKIDLAVHAIDPAWPVVTPQPISAAAASSAPPQQQQQVSQPQQQQQHPRASPKVHVNPHFFQKTVASTANATTSGAAAPGAAAAAAAASASKSSSSASTASTTTTAGDSKLHQFTVLMHKPGPDPRLKQVQPTAASATANNRAASHRMERVVVKQEPMDDVDERFRTQPSNNVFDGAPAIRSFVRRKDQEYARHSPPDGSRRRSPLAALDSEIVEKKPRIRTPPQDRDRRTESPSISSSIIRPTNDLGAHAFLSTARRAAPVAPPAPTAPNTVAIAPAPVSAMSTVTAPLIFPAIPSTSGPFLPPMLPTVPLALSVPGMPPVLTAPRMMPGVMGAQDPSLAPPVTTAGQVPPVIKNVTPRLEGITANNRIFVDGRAYEVSFINEVPVIERNGLPHRIYFTGTPRNVIIDGVAYQMAFGEKKPVLIDGIEHVLRFGAPSRELYMGDYAFKGAFGGPPISATINGVRHEIRLGGPPPEVKIEPDPYYELMRFMPGPVKASQPAPSVAEQQQQQQQQQPAAPTVDVKVLLAKLQRTGFLSSLKASNKGSEAGATDDSTTRPVTPPIPSVHRYEVTEKLPTPPTDLKSFSMRALKIRYTSVVESLHQTRSICPNCGLRFSDLKGERYQQHLDWHFKENLRTSGKSRCREWYLPIEEWYEYCEQEELTATTSVQSRRPLDGARTEQATKDRRTETNCLPSDSVTAKECGVCKERFEEYWDEDDDMWKMKDCMLGKDGRAFHPGCILDASSMRAQDERDSPSEEEHSDKFISRDLKKKFVLDA